MSFRQYLILALLCLGITFVLFEVLESFAEAQSPLLGGTIKYGGALAGFVLVFHLLSSGYGRLALGEPKTSISIQGDWDLELIKGDGSTRTGSAHIRQLGSSVRAEVSGRVKSRQTPPEVSFDSLVAVLRERRFVFLYENNRREMGIALGVIPEDKPSRFTVSYYDVSSSDYNADPQGQIVFSRANC